MKNSVKEKNVQNEFLCSILRSENLRLATQDEKGWFLRLSCGTYWVTDQEDTDDGNSSGVAEFDSPFLKLKYI